MQVSKLCRFYCFLAFSLHFAVYYLAEVVQYYLLISAYCTSRGAIQWAAVQNLNWRESRDPPSGRSLATPTRHGRYNADISVCCSDAVVSIFASLLIMYTSIKVPVYRSP